MSFQIDDDVYYNTSDAFRGNRPYEGNRYSYALAEVEELINSRLKSIVPDERKGDICFCLVLEALISDMTLHAITSHGHPKTLSYRDKFGSIHSFYTRIRMRARN